VGEGWEQEDDITLVTLGRSEAHSPTSENVPSSPALVDKRFGKLGMSHRSPPRSVFGYPTLVMVNR
jgi:hypothetical protein